MSSQDTLFCLITYLFSPIWLSLIVFPLACFPSSCFFACLLAYFLCHGMYTLGAWTHGARVRPPRREKKRAKMQAIICKPKKGNVQQIRRPSLFEWLHLSPSLLASSLEHCIRVPPHHVPFIFSCTLLGNVCFTFPIHCRAISLGCQQCLLYFPALCDSIVYDVYIPIYACMWVLCTSYDGPSWLRERPSLAMSALDLVVQVCAQGNCCRCIFMLYCVHNHRGVTDGASLLLYSHGESQVRIVFCVL